MWRLRRWAGEDGGHWDVAMARLLVIQHLEREGPGQFAAAAAARGWPLEVLRPDLAQPLRDPLDDEILLVLGGPMGVEQRTDPALAWLAEEVALLERVLARQQPVIGICLGAQLLASALGANVYPNGEREIGWFPVERIPGTPGPEVYGVPGRLTVFHWHGETFSIPGGAQRVLSSPWCENQGFALGPHLALQCHIEMTAELVHSWCDSGQREIEMSPSPAVQSVPEILADLQPRLDALHEVADAVYTRWLARCKG